jgi:predicted RNA-binding protein
MLLRETVAVYRENHTGHTDIYKLSSYLTGNTLLLRYKAQPVNAVWGNSRCLL